MLQQNGLLKSLFFDAPQDILLSPELIDTTHDKIANVIHAKSGIRGHVTIAGLHGNISIYLPTDFPASKPVVCLDKYDSFGFVPHVDMKGEVCFCHSDNILLDRYNPEGIVQSALTMAMQTIEKGIKGENTDDFLKEFDHYWISQNHIRRAISLIDINSHPRNIYYQEDNGLLYVSDSNVAVNKAIKPKPLLSGLYLPLNDSFTVSPPRFNTSWEASYLKTLYNSLNHNKQKKLRKYLSEKAGKESLLVFSFSRPSEGKGSLGIYYKNTPVVKDTIPSCYTPVSLEREDPQHLLARGGGHKSLQGKKVALIGCGAVGGHIAFELLRCGIHQLLLVDHDKLCCENRYRHVCGHASDDYKVDVIKREIAAKYKISEKIIVEKARVQDALKKKPEIITNNDLIIVAIGDPTTSLWLNEKVFNERKKWPPVLYTWLDPLSIGGHALLTNNKGSKGCFECLFYRGTDEAPYNRASFVMPNQNFTKSLAGCASMFIPYSSMDALRTAEMASRLAIDTLLGKEHHSPLLSWKGDSTEIRDNGFLLSSRYNLSQDALFDSRYEYRFEHCRICSK